MKNTPVSLPEDRYFDPDPTQRKVALEIYRSIEGLPLICPHGHVDPRLFAADQASFGSPAELLIIPDHYVFRMLHSQGIPLQALGVPRRDGEPVEQDQRLIWQIFAENIHLFRGTPTGAWLAHVLYEIFAIDKKLSGESANDIYDQISEKLASPHFQPRVLFERFNIEVLCTTDHAADPLIYHQTIRNSGWKGLVRPTFRPDTVVNLDTPGWLENITALSDASGCSITTYASFIQALEQRRTYFKSLGAAATDHAALTPYTHELSPAEAEAIFQRALVGKASAEDGRRFTAHMLMEMARMSVEDGLVMQLHPGVLRNHNLSIFKRFGSDKGADIPVSTEFTTQIRPLLEKYGSQPRFTLILFTCDETTYSRELAPLAGHYPAIKLGPPWWFNDSLNGMRRYFDRVIETAGLYNTAGFNDDTRAFPSIPARHDLWRRAAANWLAGLVVRFIVDESEAYEMARELAYGLAKKAYRL
jgi:glucuronate isomerase